MDHSKFSDAVVAFIAVVLNLHLYLPVLNECVTLLVGIATLIYFILKIYDRFHPKKDGK